MDCQTLVLELVLEQVLELELVLVLDKAVGRVAGKDKARAARVRAIPSTCRKAQRPEPLPPSPRAMR